MFSIKIRLEVLVAPAIQTPKWPLVNELLIIFRSSLSEPPPDSEYVIPLLKEWWIFVAYKLDDKEELKSAKKALSRLWAKILKVKNYRVASQDRTIVLIEKISKTHLKYPRKVWVPLSNPIK